MSKILPKPERIAGIVALSYLILIPVGAAVVLRKLVILDEEMADVLQHLGMTPPDRGRLRRFLKG